MVGLLTVFGTLQPVAQRVEESGAGVPIGTRWSADRLAVTVGTAATFPAAVTHGLTANRPKPTMATWGGMMTPKSESTPSPGW